MLLVVSRSRHPNTNYCMNMVHIENESSRVKCTLPTMESNEQCLLRQESGSACSSTSSLGLSSCRSSTISSSSEDHFQWLTLPLELELSTMGTVDQCLLDRAHVALLKRSKSFSSCRQLARMSIRRSSECAKVEEGSENDNTQMDKHGTFTTTLCSTEL